MKNVFRSFVTLLVAAPVIAALAACSAASPEPTSGSEEALPNGERGGAGGYGKGPHCVWPLAHPRYCSTYQGCVVQATHPTEQHWINMGCAARSIDVNWDAVHTNGPGGALFGTYVLCPEDMPTVQTDQNLCNACIPAAPPGQRWFITVEDVGPCQSGCPNNPIGGSTGGGGVYQGG